MVVYCVTVYVKEQHIDEFIAATAQNHRGTRREPGNIRFDVLQSADHPSRFFLYEVYESEQAVKDHKATPHYTTWREAVAEWMAQPREGLMHRVICPEDRNSW